MYLSSSTEEESQELLPPRFSDFTTDRSDNQDMLPPRFDGRGYIMTRDSADLDRQIESGYQLAMLEPIVPDRAPPDVHQYDVPSALQAPPSNYASETEPQSYGFGSASISEDAAYVSPIKEGVGDVSGDNNDQYGSAFNRDVSFTMSDFDIDIFVAKDYPFVLRLSKTSSRV